jgi:type IV pilus assembly protein PilC
LFRLIRTPSGKRVFDTVTLRLPVLSGIIRKTNSALMTRTISSLVSAGVPIVRALEITSKVVGNVHFQDSLAVAAQEVAKGGKVSESLAAYKHIYPVIVIQMIAVGEETGETAKILGKLADFFEAEVTAVTKNLTSIIEPILMLIIGSVVGFFAISMVQPMYSVLNAIQ